MVAIVVVAAAAGRGKERRLEVGGRRGQEDGFIYLSRRSSLYFTAPPEADTKTNGLSSRSCKTSPTPSPPHPRVPTGDGDSPSNANVKHRRGEEERSFNAAVNRLLDDPTPSINDATGGPVSRD